MKSFLVIVLVTISLLLGKSQQSQNFMIHPYDRSWQPFENAVVEQLVQTGAIHDAITELHNVLVALKSSAFPTAVAKNISQQCLEDSQKYVHSLYVNTSLWAIQSKLIGLT